MDSVTTVAATETAEALNNARPEGSEAGAAIGGLRGPRIGAGDGAGGESHQNRIAKPRADWGAARAADQAPEDVSNTIAGAREELDAAPPAGPCGCGCGLPTSIAQKSDRRTNAKAGQPRRFVVGHARRGRRELEFSDITAAWLDTHIVDRAGGRGSCWLADPVQVSIAGRRVYVSRLAALLHEGRPVTPEALDRLQVRRRCRHHRRCVNPDHMFIRRESEDTRLRTAAIEAARARMKALRAEPPSTFHAVTRASA